MDLNSHPTSDRTEPALAKLVLVALPEEIRTMRRHP
jgi:hypothetical protein